MKRERKKTNQKILNKEKIIYGKAKNVEKNKKLSKKTIFLSLILISVITAVSYFPIFDNEITTWDDEFYINKNSYLKEISKENTSNLFKINLRSETDVEGTPFIVAENNYMGNYHPLTMMSLSVDYAIGGEDESGNINPFMFLFTNLVLHILISLLVFWFVLILIKNFNVAIIAALLFGVHAIHVESVAWISERKDVLYSFFFLLSLVSYVKYIDNKKLSYYFVALLFFLLSLFSKGQAVSLAVTIVLIDWLRARKLLNLKVVLEKVPFFVFAVIFGLIAIGAQKESEALVEEQGYDLFQRIGIASYAFMQYIYKLILPVNLSAIYPYPDIIEQAIPRFYYLLIFPVLLVAGTFIWLLKKDKKILAFGIAFFIVNIFLLLQFIPVGSAVHADRYAYIPSIGFFILISVLLISMIKKNPKSKNLIYGITGIYIVLLGALSFMRCDIWQNSETLWTDTVEKSPKSVIAWNNLGSLKDRQAVEAYENMQIDKTKKLREEAISNFSKAIKGKPDYRNAYYNRGISKYELGKLNRDSFLLFSSIADYDSAIIQDGQFSDAYHNRGNVKSEIGMLDAAMKDYNLAIDIKKTETSTDGIGTFYANRGIAKGKKGDLNGAIEDFNLSLRINPNDAAVYSNRGRAQMLKGENEKAIEDLNISIKIDPTNYSAFLNRAVTKQKLADYEGAIFDYNKTLDLNPNLTEAYLSRGKVYILINEPLNACKDFNIAKKLGHPTASIFIQQYCK